MVGLRKAERNVNPMAGTWTKAGLVRRKFRAGPSQRKDRILAPVKAVFETCMLLDDIREKMRDAGLDPSDVHAAMVVEDSRFRYLLKVPEPKRVPELLNAVESINDPVIVGLIFVQLDREVEDPKKAAATWVHPFRVGPNAERSLAAGIQMLNSKTGKMAVN
jgi:hypothetical protein